MRVPLGPGSQPLRYASRLEKFVTECTPQTLYALRQAGGEIQVPGSELRTSASSSVTNTR